MRDSLKSTSGWLWVVAFLALPNCTFKVAGLGSFDNLNRGPLPKDSAIFCDIENKAVERHCATANDRMVGIRIAAAAVALTRSQTSDIGLDYTPSEIASHGCSPGQPVAVVFKCPFPEGCHVCLNCAAVIGGGLTYANAGEACVAHCEDQNGPVLGENPPTPEVAAFCESAAHAHESTNASGCVASSCTEAGAPLPGFVDPRRTLEPVSWGDGVGVVATGPDSNTLGRLAATTGNFDAGGASTETITKGDGYVEFTATETDKARILGLSPGAPPDGDATDADIRFGVRLSAGGHILISENGTLVVPPDANPNFWFGDYVSGDRLRVTVTDNFNGTANIAYRLIPAACVGSSCDGVQLRPTGTDPPLTASYPFRVDATLRDMGATLTDVRIVRIK